MTHNKLPLVIAIAAVIAAPAALAQSSVTVYGKMYPHEITEEGSGATPVGTPRSTLSSSLTGTNGVTRLTGMTSGNTRFGFRGKEDLGDGLKLAFQMEASFAVEDGSTAAPQLFDRDTYLGLDSQQLGNVHFGQMDTIFKSYGDTLGTLGVSSGTFMSSSNILRKPGFGTSSSARFHERWGNSIQYESPEVAGFQVGMQVSTDALPSVVGDQKGYSFGLKYDNGPWYVAIAHEIHNDFFGGSSQAPSGMRNTIATSKSKDTATQFTVEWRLNKQHSFEFDVIQKNYNETPVATATTRFGSYKNTAYQLAMENRWSSKWRTAAHYVISEAGSCKVINTTLTPCTTDGLGGSQLVVAGAYYFSKRTLVFASLSQLTNSKSARFSTSQLAGARTNYGEDLRQFAVGLSHSF